MMQAQAVKMGKVAVARPNVFSDATVEAEKVRPELRTHGRVEALPMMRMCCNILEVQRLREEIVLRMHECNLLERIYLKQCNDLSNKQVKTYTPDAIPFETTSVLKDFVNLVDLNDGVLLDFDIRLPFMEFDP